MLVSAGPDSQLLKMQKQDRINSKIRDRIELPVNITRSKVKEEALSRVKIQKYLENTKIKNEVFIKNKLLNFVVEPL